MAEDIAVDFRVLEDGEAGLRRLVDQIDVHLDQLEHTVAQLLNTWTGEAAEAYRAAQQEWDDAVAGMRDNVHALHALITTAHGNHTSAVRTNRALWEV